MLVAIGAILLGIAVYLGFGVAAFLAYAGVVLVVTGAVVTWTKSRGQ